MSILGSVKGREYVSLGKSVQSDRRGGRLSFAFGRLLGRRRAFWFVTGGIVVYVLLVGSDAAVVRAGVMAVLLLTARYLGRLSTAYVSLFAAAAFLTIVNPFLLWDVGFQLSFAASLGLILFALPMQRCGQDVVGRGYPWQTARSVGLYLRGASLGPPREVKPGTPRTHWRQQVSPCSQRENFAQPRSVQGQSWQGWIGQ